MWLWGYRGSMIASFTFMGRRYDSINWKATEKSVRVPDRSRSLTVINCTPFHLLLVCTYSIALGTGVEQTYSSPPFSRGIKGRRWNIPWVITGNYKGNIVKNDWSKAIPICTHPFLHERRKTATHHLLYAHKREKVTFFCFMRHKMCFCVANNA